jgi:predicted Zn-dependent protease
VLGHEIGHVTARHSAKQITQQQLASLGLAVGGAFVPSMQRFSGTAQQALGLLMLKYSRDDETQADALGIRYATAAGYDPREIPHTYATLKRISDKAGSSLPGYLSTHPDPGDREARTSALAEQAVAGRANLEIGAHRYLEHLRGVAFGDDPRQGWLEGAHFRQPTLGFELDLPQGWTAQNSRSALAAANAGQKAALQWTVAPNAGAMSPEDYVAALRRDGRISGMEGRGETIGGGFAAWEGHVSVTGTDGTARVLDAAWVRVSDATLLQCLGSSAAAGDADERAIFACVRSVRYLPPSQRDVQPDRVRVKVAPMGGTPQALLTRLGPSSQSLDDFAILNGVATDDRFMTGDWVKIVEAGRK